MQKATMITDITRYVNSVARTVWNVLKPNQINALNAVKIKYLLARNVCVRMATSMMMSLNVNHVVHNVRPV